ncbi:hypothetical protein E2562_008388 [Oryza meyeriana var. granulata]|uniref:Uncharacterized protein n=1 Tax=Oryza meyeriana var. granulata TaxID=110450 RepID=A0A6G1EGW6_9ORYZ|nr:hypothetical protein E2562_008388 [Oryza meyeriana var. granulata]
MDRYTIRAEINGSIQENFSLSNGAVEDGLPSMVSLEDYGDCNWEARTVVDNVDTIADITREYADPQILAPVVGQSFKTDAFNFYNVYTVSKGFGIRLSKDRLNSDKNKTMREICCSHETTIHQWQVPFQRYFPIPIIVCASGTY